ncbi:glycoside hydrolase superfamily [Gorgonomyces haynaldii]|nr:glycoside hydrolase superfamily [Gorgonomyces haynaldii]
MKASPGIGVLDTNGRFFKTKDGRTAFLRGVNLSGSVKQPYRPYMPSHQTNGFFDHRDVSFVGRPFPLSEADEHLARLRHWGFNFLRFQITWEAIEHAGPGIYDDDYCRYVCQVLLKAREYGFRVFVDPHQDVWSRFSGGSGAPGWTFDLAGLDPRNFAAGNAAIVQNTFPEPAKFPKMIWSTNYFKLAAGTMFTLFFGGSTFAPQCKVNGESVQEFLQRHYIDAVCHLAKFIVNTPGLKDDVVMGYDTLNEPSSGFIELNDDITKIPHLQELKNGLTPTFMQSVILGNGQPVDNVQYWELSAVGPQKTGEQRVDPKGIRCWKDGHECLWAQHGVWDPKTGQPLKKNYFAVHPETGERVNFLVDYWKPFVNRFAKALRKVHQDCVVFVEPPVNAKPPVFDNSDCTGKLVFAPHFYDGLTLLNKTFNQWFTVDYIGFLRGNYSSVVFAIKFGIAGIKGALKSQLDTLRAEGTEFFGDYPCVFGEIGIPFDMDNKIAYQTGDYSQQIKAMDCNMSALERNLLSFTLWNYCSDNNNEWGDQWNGEDLSLWSDTDPDRKREGIPEDLNRGGRAVEAFCRPYPLLIPGEPTWINFDLEDKYFEVKFRRVDYHGDSNVFEAYVPKLHFKKDSTSIWVSDGSYEWDEDNQRLLWTVDPANARYQSGENRRVSAITTVHVLKMKAGTHIEIEEDTHQDRESNACPSCNIM